MLTPVNIEYVQFSVADALGKQRAMNVKYTLKVQTKGILQYTPTIYIEMNFKTQFRSSLRCQT